MRNTQASLSIIPHDAQSLIALSDVDEMSMTETGEIYVAIYVLLIIIIIGTSKCYVMHWEGVSDQYRSALRRCNLQC